MNRERLVFGTYDVPAPGLLDRFVAGGGSALDVANVYRDGESSRTVARWLRGRDDVVLYAKGCHPPHCAPELVGAEIDVARSLLGVDRLDVFLLHRDDPSLPVAAWADALRAPVAAGTIGAFGVSNWTVDRLRALHREVGGDGPLRAFSNHFSLASMVAPPWPDCRAVSGSELRAVGGLGVSAICWSSLATGFFAGRSVASWDSAANRERRERARSLAGDLGTTPTAVALAYVLAQPPHVLAAVGTTSAAHLDDAFAAAELSLTATQLAWLEAH